MKCRTANIVVRRSDVQITIIGISDARATGTMQKRASILVNVSDINMPQAKNLINLQ